MRYLGQNRLEEPAFVPPEPYKKPTPRRVQIAIWVAAIAIGILDIWLALHR